MNKYLIVGCILAMMLILPSVGAFGICISGPHVTGDGPVDVWFNERYKMEQIFEDYFGEVKVWLGGYTTGHLYYFHAGVEAQHFKFEIENNETDTQMLQDLENKYKNMARHLHTALIGDYPPQPLNKRGFDCNYCEFKEECIAHNNRGEK